MQSRVTFLWLIVYFRPKTPYIVQEPNTNIVVRVGDKIGSIVCNLAPIACGLFTIASAWAGLSVYGAITFAHVCGRDGVRILRAASPLKLFLAMPVIPLVLVLVRVRVAVRLRVTRHANGQPVEVSRANCRSSYGVYRKL